jgi:hypothetical protein
MNHALVRVAPVVLLAAVGLVGCSSSGGSAASSTAAPQSSPATSSAAPTSATPTSAAPSGAPCTEEALQSVVPEGSTVESFVCDSVTDQQWAAGKASAPGGSAVFFAKADAPSTTWEAVQPEEICGTASAGLPPKILAFCE